MTAKVDELGRNGFRALGVTRTPSAFWDKPYPSLQLLIPLECTQVVGTLVAVYGILIAPVGWLDAAYVWAYAFVWMLLLNGIKMLTYKVQSRLNM